MERRGIRAKWTMWVKQRKFEPIRERLSSVIPRGAKLLDIGAGDGFFADLLAKIGFDVTAIDIKPLQPGYFSVGKGDCTHLGFQDSRFDVIFSSQALHYVYGLSAAFSEMKRVLKSNGIIVVILPTHYAGILTQILQPLGYLLKVGIAVGYAVRYLMGSAVKHNESPAGRFSSRKYSGSPLFTKENLDSAFKYLNPIRFFITWPIGVYPDCVSQILDWRPKVWRKKFEEAGFKVKEIIPLHPACSMHALFPFMFIKFRYWLSFKGMYTTAAYFIKK